MAIKTSTFGGVTLTGEAAKKFKKQFLNPKTESNNTLAQEALEKGRVLIKEIQQKGYAVILPPEGSN